MERLNQLLRGHPIGCSLASLVLFEVIPTAASYWGLFSQKPPVPELLSWIRTSGEVAVPNLSLGQFVTLTANLVGLVILVRIWHLARDSDNDSTSEPESDERIEELPVERSIIFLGSDVKNPAVFMARNLQLMNTGEDTVLRNWEMAVSPPGAGTYSADIIDQQGWAELKRIAGARVTRDLHKIVLHNTVIEINRQNPRKLSVIAMVPGLVQNDINRVGTEVAVKCTDGFGKEWRFTGDMTARVIE